MAGGKFGGGDGTSAKPFLIEDADDMNQIRNHLSSYFKLISNINLGEPPYNEKTGWEPIEGFTGVLDGNKKKVFNLTINLPTTDNVGLFANYNVSSASKYQPIYDIMLQNVNIVGRNNVGALIGYIEGYTDAYALGTEISAFFRRVYVDGYIEGNNNIGGLAGYINANKLGGTGKTIALCTDCVNNATLSIINGNSNGIGQIIGACGDTWNEISVNTKLAFFRTVCTGIISTNSKKPIKLGNLFYNVNNLAVYTDCYIDSSNWDTTNMDDSGLNKLDTSELQKADTITFTNTYSDGQYIWSTYDGRYPQLMFTSDDYFFIKANADYYYYDFVQKAFVILGNNITRQLAITYGNPQLQQIPSSAWDFFKSFNSVELINIIDKTDSTVQTSQTTVLNLNDSYISDNTNKGIYTNKFKFNTRFGNLSTMTGW